MTAKKKDKRPLFEQVGDDGYTWQMPDRDFVRGDIMRTPQNDDKPSDGWLYGVCSGNGFGCTRSLIGNAIFMLCESRNLKDVIDFKNDETTRRPGLQVSTPQSIFVVRWEKRWYIQIPVGEIFA